MDIKGDGRNQHIIESGTGEESRRVESSPPPFPPFWKRGAFKIFIFLLILAVAAIAWRAFQTFSPVDPPSQSDILAFFIIVVTVATIFVISIYLFGRSERKSEDQSHLFALAVTIISFFAFGLPHSGEGLEDKLPKILAVLVLFLLAELAIESSVSSKFLIKEIRDTGLRIQRDIDISVKEAQKVLIESSTNIRLAAEAIAASKIEESIEELKETANAALQISVFEKATQELGDPLGSRFRKHTLNHMEVVSRLVKSSFDTFPDPTNKQALQCAWTAVLDSYIVGETAGFGKKMTISGIEYDAVEICVDTGRYLDLLSRLATSMIGFVKANQKHGGVRIVYDAITNILPEYWLNWRNVDDRQFQFERMDDFRNHVITLIREHRDVLVYRRLLLLQKPSGTMEAKRIGLRGYDEFYRQMTDRFLLLTKESRIEDGAFPLKALTVRQWKDKLGKENSQVLSRCWTDLNDDEFVYLLVTKEELTNLKLSDELNDQMLERKDDDPLVIRTRSLQDFYVHDLHSGPEHANYCRPELDQIQALPDGNPDSLMVGFTRASGAQIESRDVTWVMAIFSSLRFDCETTIAQVITDPKALDILGRYHHELDKAHKLVADLQTPDLKEV